MHGEHLKELWVDGGDVLAQLFDLLSGISLHLTVLDERLSEALVEHQEHGPKVLAVSPMAAFPLIWDVVHEVGYRQSYRPEFLYA